MDSIFDTDRMEERKELVRNIVSTAEWIPLRSLAYWVAFIAGETYVFNGRFHDTKARRALTADIKSINEDPGSGVIIIHGERGVKAATRDEAEAFLRCGYEEVFRKLAMLRSVERKAGLDGQELMTAAGAVSVFREEAV